MKQQIRAIVLVGAAFALASCQNFPDLFNSSIESTTPGAIAGEVTASPVTITGSRAAEVDEPDISALKADNARLERRLAGVLRENARLRRDLADLRDDNSLLKDLAVKKQR